MYKRSRLGIAYLPQEPSVFRKFTVEDNIWSILETRKDLTKEQKIQRLESLIDEFSIERIRKQKAYIIKRKINRKRIFISRK
jgi:lipopolysaccharide export system ATP-binding protein